MALAQLADMLIRFDVQKTIEASAALLRSTEGKRMSRLRLLKLLYIADRESLEETEQPITGDAVSALDHGPVLSETYNLIKGEAYASHEWQRYFRNSDQDVELEIDPGAEKLCRYEIRKLTEIAERFRHENDWAVAEHTHGFEEWLMNQPPKGSSRPIAIRDILNALGMADDYDALLAEARSRRKVDQALARAGQ